MSARARTTKPQNAKNGATLGFEAKLWATADALRGSMDAAEYKHVVLGLIFLKYISDAFVEYHMPFIGVLGDEEDAGDIVQDLPAPGRGEEAPLHLAPIARVEVCQPAEFPKR